MKWLTSIVILGILLLVAFSYLHARALRHASIIHGKAMLRMAYRDFEKSGAVTNYGGSTQIVSYTNVAVISGSNYPCVIAVVEPYFGTGVLAITTNQVFIWFDQPKVAKIIDDNYRPPLFPPRF